MEGERCVSSGYLPALADVVSPESSRASPSQTAVRVGLLAVIVVKVRPLGYLSKMRENEQDARRCSRGAEGGASALCPRDGPFNMLESAFSILFMLISERGVRG
jgi:hypothetical protein